MANPFDALRSPPEPVAPSAEFSTHLRARLTRALGLPKGVIVSDTDLDTTDLDPAAGDETTRTGETTKQGDIVYASLWVGDVRRAADFYATALGWEYEPDEYPQGRSIAGVTPHHGLWEERDPAKQMLMVVYAVDDIAAAVERVRAAGGTAEDPSDQPYGVVASCVDVNGVPFAVWHALPGEPPAPRGPASGEHHGDLSYVTLEVVDSAPARAFYGAVLEWEFVPGASADGWGPGETPAPMLGLGGGQARDLVIPMYRVDDVASTVDLVRGAGGTARAPEQRPYGTTADCVDDQGMRFWIWQP
jgi:uncharacterized protein